ncbi:hypothetical protein [Actinocorallia sp. A-T 12471]|uniref:hypothetical protein n=1 Tax=Actinocorallia sp. A-T 12471 TaxID=3089813 RepID=UPI0029CF8C6B|nr:hypothetical protein [Actinocorallia sp. A-T 12471]MDX6744916.1 hypothetical protein [Actinocorallia sp. A-T 12471]
MTAALLSPPAPRVRTARIVVTGGRAADRAAFAAHGVALNRAVVVELVPTAAATPHPAALADALGAIVLLDVDDPQSARAALDVCEDTGVSAALAVPYGELSSGIADALGLEDTTPLLGYDAADASASCAVVRALLRSHIVAATP